MCFLRYTWRIKMAAGVMPEMRVAYSGLVSSCLHGIITRAKNPLDSRMSIGTNLSNGALLSI